MISRPTKFFLLSICVSLLLCLSISSAYAYTAPTSATNVQIYDDSTKAYASLSVGDYWKKGGAASSVDYNAYFTSINENNHYYPILYLNNLTIKSPLALDSLVITTPLYGIKANGSMIINLSGTNSLEFTGQSNQQRYGIEIEKASDLDQGDLKIRGSGTLNIIYNQNYSATSGIYALSGLDIESGTINININQDTSLTFPSTAIGIDVGELGEIHVNDGHITINVIGAISAYAIGDSSDYNRSFTMDGGILEASAKAVGSSTGNNNIIPTACAINMRNFTIEGGSLSAKAISPGNSMALKAGEIYLRNGKATFSSYGANSFGLFYGRVFDSITKFEVDYGDFEFKGETAAQYYYIGKSNVPLTPYNSNTFISRFFSGENKLLWTESATGYYASDGSNSSLYKYVRYVYSPHSNLPKTGDSTNIELLVLLMLFSFAGLIVIFINKRNCRY